MKRSPGKLPKLAPVNRETIQQQVYQKLRSALMRGRFEPGDPVTLRALATAFGTSAMPVREALRQLVAEQALVARANRSLIVPLITAERLDELRRIRVALEGMATEVAAEKITPADTARLEALNQEMVEAVASDDVKRYLAKNQEFHFIIYASARLPTALRLIENMWLQVGPVLNFLLEQEVGEPGASLDRRSSDIFDSHHRAAIEALQRGDGPAARLAITQDITDAADFLLASDHLRPRDTDHGQTQAQ